MGYESIDSHSFNIMIQEEDVTEHNEHKEEPAGDKEEPAGVLVVMERWVQWFGQGVESYCEYYGLKEVEGQKNIIEQMVEKVESYTGPLEETVLMPHVIADAIQVPWNAIATAVDSPTPLKETVADSPKPSEWKEVPKIESGNVV